MRNNIKPPTKNENNLIKFLIMLGIVSILNFLYFFFQSDYRGNLFLYSLLLISLLYGIAKKLYLWYNYSNISIPLKPESTEEFTVDILTTYFPGEPRQMVITTLEAILKIKYPHETYLCDEADDPYLKNFCENNGIHHVTRDNRIDAKAGNINNTLRKFAKGEIVVILDPDHIPDSNFLDEVIPYFSNPEIGFVQTVQGYYNTKETLVARGAAEQTFQFYGPMMMTLNSYGSVNAIGANCVFRRSALDSIGGHAPGLCEDMHTAMKLYAKDWKGVYVPKILAQGLSPSNITSYFKQQLKWARGTFDLLFNVYPRLFKDFSNRQRIHFGILPLHYLSGVICLINFIIPIISLLFSVTPWKGNIIDFGLALLPVVVSSILIRTFIQKWVIERKERGFHIIGGLLEINTWWIYLLGLFYTIIDRKIPYLPTPKENEFATNLKIITPNFLIATLSLLAVFIGLSRDYTPFNILMSGFAIFNAIIMVLGIYLTIKSTNENNILKNNLNKKVLKSLNTFKFKFYSSGNSIFNITRITALPLLLLILIGSIWLKQQQDLSKWENLNPIKFEINAGSYLGIFQPDRDTGIVNLKQIDKIEMKQDVDFDIISIYLGWDLNDSSIFPESLMDSIVLKDAIPMITWEPWINQSASTGETRTSGIFKQISNGDFDDYISNFGKKLAEFDRPVYLRFAHEFDNPQYPWSQTNGDLKEEFKAAWKHVYNIIRVQGAHKVIMVWNPWQSEEMLDYYPGDDYVDWIGITLLNYGPLNRSGQSVSFKNLYQPFHDNLFWFTKKPVMLAEFGSINTGSDQVTWLKEAAKTIESDFPEISAIVMFNSSYDNNIPEGRIHLEKYINWKTDSISLFKTNSKNPSFIFKEEESLETKQKKRTEFAKKLRGVRYKKGVKWNENYYVLSRETLLNDFNLMKENGINTILYPGGNVYDYNTLKYAAETGIKILFDFQLIEPSNFLVDSLKLKKQEKAIFDKIEEIKTNPNLIGFSFNFQPELYHYKPLLFQQRHAMIKWYRSILSKIKSQHPSIPLIVNLQLNHDTQFLLKKLNEQLPADYFGLIIQDTLHLDETIDYIKNKEMPVFISSIPPEIYDFESLKPSSVIIQNWQDERLSNKLSFDGILDFEGRKKNSFRRISEQWGKNFSTEHDANIRILKPAVPLLANENMTYKAMIFRDNKWIRPEETDRYMLYEWTLIKTDTFGNPLAVKQLGTGHKISFKIPENYEHYKLLLTVESTSEDYVMRTISNLNTPLKTSEN